MRGKKWAGLIVFISVMLILSACGSSSNGSGPAGAAGSGASGGNAEAEPNEVNSSPDKLEKVTFGLDWHVLGRHAPYFVALEKGFYKEAGLDVEITRGNGSADAVKRVGAGNVDYAFGDIGSLIVSRSQDINVKSIGVVYAKAPHVIWHLDTGAEWTPKDLEGKTIGAPAGSAVFAVFPAFAKANQIDESKVKWVTLDSASLYSMLLTKKVDGIVDYAMAFPTVNGVAKEAGLTVTGMYYSDHGVSIYSNGLLATDSTIADKADRTKRFVQATMKGLKYTIDNPEEAADILVSDYKELNREAVLEEIRIISDLTQDENVIAAGLGNISEEKMQSTIDVIREAFSIEAEVSPSEVYTNEFLTE